MDDVLILPWNLSPRADRVGCGALPLRRARGSRCRRSRDLREACTGRRSKGSPPRRHRPRGSPRQLHEVPRSRPVDTAARDHAGCVAHNTRAGTVRGLHFQARRTGRPSGCGSRRRDPGRPGRRPRRSPTYGDWTSIELAGRRRRRCPCRTGVAHGYQTLVDDTTVVYLITGEFARAARTLLWDDPALGHRLAAAGLVDLRLGPDAGRRGRSRSSHRRGGPHRTCGARGAPGGLDVVAAGVDRRRPARARRVRRPRPRHPSGGVVHLAWSPVAGPTTARVPTTPAGGRSRASWSPRAAVSGSASSRRAPWSTTRRRADAYTEVKAGLRRRSLTTSRRAGRLAAAPLRVRPSPAAGRPGRPGASPPRRDEPL